MAARHCGGSTRASWRRRGLAALFLLRSAWLAGCTRWPLGEAGSSGCECPECTKLEDRVVGGVEVDPPGRYPFVVNLARGGVLEFCGGSLIAPDVVLTAAHCDLPGTSVWIGRHHLRQGVNGVDYESHEIAGKAYPDPRWDPVTNDNDVMLLRLATPSKYPTVALDPGDAVEQVETGRLRVTVLGWGATKHRGRRSSVLREATVNGFSRAACNSPVFYDGDITPNMLCAAGPGQDSCQGDSGGPLLVDTLEQAASGREYGEDVLVGVVSWGIGCAKALDDGEEAQLGGLSSFPGVYVRLANYRQWLVDQLAAWGTAPRFAQRQGGAGGGGIGPQSAPSSSGGGTGRGVGSGSSGHGIGPHLAPTAPGAGNSGDGGSGGGGSTTMLIPFSALPARKPCRELPMFHVLPGSPEVCATSRGPGGACMDDGAHSYFAAESACAELGGRLCSVSELRAGEGRESGCGLNREKLWAADSCAPGRHIAAYGGNGGSPVCLPDYAQLPGVRCCADA